MNTHVSTRKAPQTATATAAAGAPVSCPWCAATVATAVWPGEAESVYADHPLPGGSRGRLRCPASGLTRSEVEPPGGPR